MTIDLWTIIDIETEGLDPKKHRILEVGLIVVKAATLEPVLEMQVTVPPPSHKESFERCDEVVQRMHTENGLFKDLETARTRATVPLLHNHDRRSALVNVGATSMESLDDHLCRAVKDAGVEEGRMLLAGSSIWSLDIPFIRHHLFRFPKLMHYRTLDVRALKLAHSAWSTDKLPDLQPAHRAHADCVRTLVELRWLRDRAFSTGTSA